MSAAGTLDAVVVGAGSAGIGAAIRLRQRGIRDIAVLERDDRIGAEIPRAAGESGARPLIRLGHEVTALAFDEPGGRWEVSLAGRPALRARTVVLATGSPSTPRYPAIPGLDRFAGEVVHSTRWEHGSDVTGKRIAVIGSGADVVRLVPELVRTAEHVKVFQRTPGWVLPRPDPALLRHLPGAQRLARGALFRGHEPMAAGVLRDSPLARVAEQAARLHLRARVRDPWLRRRLTPHPAGCAPLLLSNDWYPALQQPRCTLVSWPITEIRPHGVRTAEGIEHRADHLVLATGVEQGPPFPVTGRGGRSLAADRCGAAADHPNLFRAVGPAGHLYEPHRPSRAATGLAAPFG